MVRGNWRGLNNALCLLFFHRAYPSLLLSFLTTFFLPSYFPWHPLWHKLCITTLNDDSKGKSPFQQPAHPSHTLLTYNVFHHYFSFFSRSDEMPTDIGSLAPGLEGHVVRLGIETTIFFRCTPFYCRISLVKLLIECTSSLPIPFRYYHWYLYTDGRPFPSPFAWFLQ
jgi:hypothetical protein